MARLQWGTVGSRFYETGIDRGVLYVDGEAGVAWSGLTSVEQNPSGGDPKAYYIDGAKYLNVASAEEFEATISAFTYPDLFAECDGTAQVRSGMFLTQQRRKPFGFSYRTLIGNDLDATGHGYKIHIVYNALAAPSQSSYATVDDSPEPADFSWTVTTRPPAITGYKRTAHVVIDSRSTDIAVLSAIEDVLYGDETNSPRLPSISELMTMYDDLYVLVVTDNGDGTYSVTGPDSVVQMLDANTWQITSPLAVYIDTDIYTITSS